jgi:hypothetical protein
MDEPDHHSQTEDLYKHQGNVIFQLTPSTINNRNSQRKPFNIQEILLNSYIYIESP